MKTPLGFKCPKCNSANLFFEPAAGHGEGCEISTTCYECYGRSTIVFTYHDAYWTETKDDQNWNFHIPAMFGGADDYDHFAFHAGENTQKG